MATSFIQTSDGGVSPDPTPSGFAQIYEDKGALIVRGESTQDRVMGAQSLLVTGTGTESVVKDDETILDFDTFVSPIVANDAFAWDSDNEAVLLPDSALWLVLGTLVLDNTGTTTGTFRQVTVYSGGDNVGDHIEDAQDGQFQYMNFHAVFSGSDFAVGVTHDADDDIDVTSVRIVAVRLM